jgi:hypothetical protein
MKLNPKKVLQEIERLQKEVDGFLNREVGEFEKIYDEALSLCEEVFPKKADYKKIIDSPFSETPMQIIIDDFTGGEKQIKVPSDEDVLNGRKDIATELLLIVEKAHRKYSLKLRLVD